MRMLVSSLCITLPCAACRINSSSASRSGFAAAAISSHCVAAGKGIPSCPCSLSSRLNGTPVPYFNRAIMATAVSSYFAGPAVSGSSAVKTSPQALQRSRSISNTVASSGACPTNLTSVAGSFWR